MVSIWFLYVSLCYLCMPCFKRSSSSLQYISLFFFQVLGHPPVIKQSTGKPPFVNDFPISTSIYLYIYMDFQLPCLMTRRQFCLRFLVENMRKIYRPQHIPESSTIERWRMLLCFMISAWLIGLNPDILALIQRQDNHRC